MSGKWNVREVNRGRLVLVGFVAATVLIAASSAAVAQDAATGVAAGLTFTKDVAPILQRSCQVCHRPGSIAPMSLLTYEDARPWARAIKQRVTKRDMPPWFLDRTVGIQKFKADPSLSPKEIDTIVTWVDSGAPQGNPADMPRPREFRDMDRWTIGEPDLIIPIPEPFVVEANAPNWWVDLVSDSGLTEDRWIKAHETKPSLEGFSVVHHATTRLVDESNPDNEVSFSEYALGKNGDIYPEDAGFLIKAGTKIVFNMHYAANGKRTTDRTSLGLKFHPRGYVPKYKHTRQSVGNVQDLDLPPGESNIRHEGYRLLNDNIRLTVFQPHLHNRGKRQCLEAIYTDGRVETLNCVNWDFGWHIAYNYGDEMAPLLPKGTILHVVSWHDNSSGNKWNPDPRNWTGFGQRSSDDMAFAHISWYALSDEEFEQEVKARRAATSNNN